MVIMYRCISYGNETNIDVVCYCIVSGITLKTTFHYASLFLLILFIQLIHQNKNAKINFFGLLLLNNRHFCSKHCTFLVFF